MGNCSSHNTGKLSNQRFFKVTILDPNYIEGSKGAEIGSGSIEITKYELVLHQSGMQTLRWPYLSLTKYTSKGNIFIFEANSNKMLPGFTDRRVFLLKGANVLYNQIQALIVENSIASRSIKSGSSKHSLENNEINNISKKRFKENIDTNDNLYVDPVQLHHPELDLANVPFSRLKSNYHSSRHLPRRPVQCDAMVKNQRLSGLNQLSESNIMLHNNNLNKQQKYLSIGADDLYYHSQMMASSNRDIKHPQSAFYSGMLMPPFLQQNYALPLLPGPPFISQFPNHHHHNPQPSINRVYFPPDELRQSIKMSFSKALKNSDRRKKLLLKHQTADDDSDGDRGDGNEVESDNTVYISKQKCSTRKRNILHNKSIHRSLEMLDLDINHHKYPHHIPNSSNKGVKEFVNEDSVNAIYYC